MLMASTLGVLATSTVSELERAVESQAQLTFSSLRPRQAGPPQLKRQSVDLRSLPLAQRLSCIPGALAQRFQPGTLALVQVWTSCIDGRWAGVAASKPGAVVFRTQPVGASLSDPALAPFRAACCEGGITRSAIGMLGKVWSSGALAVVQNVAIIPTSVHPRNKLDDAVTERVAELAYIPVYDLRQPDAGVVACLEVMMSASATSALVANIISHTCDLLTQFQLSLGRPASSPAAIGTSPFAAAALQPPPPHIATRASMDCPRQLPPIDRNTCSAATAPPTGGILGGSSCSNSSSSSSGPSSPGTPAALAPQPPPRRSLSMTRTSSVRRLNSLADMHIG